MNLTQQEIQQLYFNNMLQLSRAALWAYHINDCSKQIVAYRCKKTLKRTIHPNWQALSAPVPFLGLKYASNFSTT